MACITLIGTVHLDTHGFDKLRRVLMELMPRVITVEVSPYAVSFRKTRGPALLSMLDPFRGPDNSLPAALQAVEAQLRIPFELEASLEHASASHARVIPIGESRRSRVLLKRLEQELMSPDNLKKLCAREEQVPLARQVEKSLRVARQQFEEGPLVGTVEARRLALQEAFLARAIRRNAVAAPLVHVGGWEHLVGLSILLKEIAPDIRLLC